MRFDIIDYIKYHINKHNDLTIYNGDIEQYYGEVLHKDKYIYDYQAEKIVSQIYDIAENLTYYGENIEKFSDYEYELLTNLIKHGGYYE